MVKWPQKRGRRQPPRAATNCFLVTSTSDPRSRPPANVRHGGIDGRRAAHRALRLVYDGEPVAAWLWNHTAFGGSTSGSRVQAAGDPTHAFGPRGNARMTLKVKPPTSSVSCSSHWRRVGIRLFGLLLLPMKAYLEWKEKINKCIQR